MICTSYSLEYSSNEVNVYVVGEPNQVHLTTNFRISFNYAIVVCDSRSFLHRSFIRNRISVGS